MGGGESPPCAAAAAHFSRHHVSFGGLTEAIKGDELHPGQQFPVQSLKNKTKRRFSCRLKDIKMFSVIFGLVGSDVIYGFVVL